ncbi:MAG TPA: hypothetical protein VK454_05940 [Myxococcaceae bacterium]|nr:hypothetical protein [Myxococcaceae bacterium]
MSPEAHPSALTHAPGELEDKNLPYRKIIVVGVGTIVIFALSIVWSTTILRNSEKEMHPAGPPPLPAGVNQYEVGIVNQRMFSLDQRAAQKRLQQMDRLNRYGWIDRQAGVAHIPIDVAMEMMLEEKKK